MRHYSYTLLLLIMFILSSISVLLNAESTTTTLQSSVIYLNGYPISEIYDPSNGYVYVFEYYADCVVVLSGTNIVGKISVGGNPSFGVYDPYDNYIYVFDSNPYQISVIRGLQLITNIPLQQQANYYYQLPSIFYNQNYFILFYGYSAYVISGYTMVRDVYLGYNINSIIYPNGSNYLFLLTSFGNIKLFYLNNLSVSGYDLNNGGGYYGVYDNVNGYVYVVDGNSINVYTANGEYVGEIYLSSSYYSGSQLGKLSYNTHNGIVYVPNSNNNDVLVISGLQVISNISVGNYPICTFFDPSNSYVYVLNSQSGTVSVISGTQVISNIYVGMNPFRLVYDDDSGCVAIISEKAITILSGTQVISNITVNSSPYYAIIANGALYASFPNNNTVLVIFLNNQPNINNFISGISFPGSKYIVILISSFILVIGNIIILRKTQ